MATKDEARALIDALVDAYNRKDERAIALLYAPDVRYWSALGGTNEGKDEVLSHVRELFRELPNEQMRADAVVTDGDVIVVEFTSTGTSGVGEPYTISFTEVIELRDGLLGDIKVYLDPDEVAAITG